ncbi:MAG: hypothetical protein AB7S70_16500 [Hyphomicrobium sp.]|uniref:hypothetical protein n=1 Tax=Hyphomicrobium sp. TaxID=82 RepID=UPI003D0A3460
MREGEASINGTNMAAACTIHAPQAFTAKAQPACVAQGWLDTLHETSWRVDVNVGLGQEFSVKRMISSQIRQHAAIAGLAL